MPNYTTPSSLRKKAALPPATLYANSFEHLDAAQKTIFQRPQPAMLEFGIDRH
ncbi:MAG: hypothetical protein Q8O85_07885 [Rhodoferax sp.]|uniref:hypothetical protein n=1 Tax=Rhodoferax sp. TaxID=50421 RepID=UPI002733F763|nr:hypothetical protein [Rhodoferax sp.]MDP2678626.1 hypothetical protein [Rhodoferax sp.]